MDENYPRPRSTEVTCSLIFLATVGYPVLSSFDFDQPTSEEMEGGALFEVGDGHAAQGDGEVCVTAIETNLTGVFRFTVRKDMKLRWPRAETPLHAH